MTDIANLKKELEEKPYNLQVRDDLARMYFYRGMTDQDEFGELSVAAVLDDPIPEHEDEWDTCGYVNNRNGSDYYVFFQDFDGDAFPDL